MSKQDHGVRCEAMNRSGTRCRSIIGRLHGALYDRLGFRVMVCCANHQKVLMRGGKILTNHGFEVTYSKEKGFESFQSTKAT